MEQAIVDAFVHNDNQRIQQFYKEVYPMALSFMKGKFPTLQEADVQDVYQDAVIALWSNIQNGKLQLKEGVKVSTYLLQICKFKTLDRFKLKSSKMEVTNQEIVNRTDIPDEAVVEDERSSRILQAIQQMKDRCKQLLHLFYFEKVSLEEIAEQLAIGASSVKNEKYRCMQRLKAAMN